MRKAEGAREAARRIEGPRGAIGAVIRDVEDPIDTDRKVRTLTESATETENPRETMTALSAELLGINLHLKSIEGTIGMSVDPDLWTLNHQGGFARKICQEIQKK